MIRALSKMWSTTVAVLRTDWWVVVGVAALWFLSVVASQNGHHHAAAGTGVGAGILFAIILDTTWKETRRRERECA